MTDIDVLLLVNLPEQTPYQEVEFFQQLEKQGWQLVNDSNALYAAYPGSTGDAEVVAQSEREVRQAAEYSGVKDWDAVCLIKDSSKAFLSHQFQREHHARFEQNDRPKNRRR